MSGSRFVLKQIHVRGTGSSDLTRYVAKSKLDTEREGKSPRELFTIDEDNLTYWEARKWLSITGGALQKKDVLHYVLSFANEREYELLGDSEEARKREIIGFLRQAIPASLREVGIKQMRWVAGIHRNTDNPHVHLLLNKNAVGSDTNDLIRVPRLTAPLIAHHTKMPDGQREFSYGLLIKTFAAQVDAKHRDRARFLQFENAIRTAKFTRELLSSDTLNVRPPSDEERLIGKWIIAEIESSRPFKSHTIKRAGDSLQEAQTHSEQKLENDEQRTLMNLRERVATLDHAAMRQGNEPPRAFIETGVLHDILTAPQHGLLIRTHEQNPHLAVSYQRESPIRQAELAETLQQPTRTDGREQKSLESRNQPRIPAPPTHTR